VKMSITTNFPEVARQLERMQKDIANKAVASALNKTVAQAQTAMSTEIRKEFNLTATEVRQSLSIIRARGSGKAFTLQATLQATSKRGRSLNLIRFTERSISFAQARKRMAAGEGGKYALRRGGVVTKALELRFKIKKKGAPVTIKGAFIANKGRTVFIREGKERLPIKALQTIDVPQMFNTRIIKRKVTVFMQTKFPAIFANEAKFFTDRFNAGRS